MTGKEECLFCRVTYSIFERFPDVPSGLVMNVETGNFFLLAALRSYSSGYDMTEALGTAWACQCRERSADRFDEGFTLKDNAGKRLTGVRYRVRVGSSVLASGVTDSQGRTQRISTGDPKRLSVDVAAA
jgi:hypothetical protein